jgi:glycolate oxidase
MPGKITFKDDFLLEIAGGITWKEAWAFARSKGRDLMIWPTEESANVLAGVATNCTGERSFAFKTLREQIEKIFYLDFQGQEQVLSHKNIPIPKDILLDYQQDYAPYRHMKNAPFPRLEKEMDLMIGMEGQLGVITKIYLKTIPKIASKNFIIPLNKWELDISDIILIELDEKYFEQIYEEFFNKLEMNKNEIWELSERAYHQLRISIPRKIQESNLKKGVIKKGTDCQVTPKAFKKLLELYQSMGKRGILYTLFGHFGDAHLHFNFLPTKEQTMSCQEYLEDFYLQLRTLGGSPFAEHGIGLLKQDYIRPFLSGHQLAMFHYLKKIHDPSNQFFPKGFLSI